MKYVNFVNFDSLYFMPFSRVSIVDFEQVNVWCNPGQGVWNRIEGSNKTGQEKESLISTSACFLTAAAGV